MDMANQFETPNTYRLHRAEYLFGLLVALVLFIMHIGEIRWIPAILLFVYIDLIGYIPGAIAFRRSKTGHISKGYYVAYNIMHSMVTQGAVAVVWTLVYGPDWTLLVLPLHLFADRGIFGNFLKSFKLPFEPVPNPAFQQFIQKLTGGGAPAASEQPVATGAGATR
ncbi:hypothetical protein [Phytohabitans houttuyneae]|jgi:hypothetical protein|uniref:Integral membrane protein n=1 Tax=Phytohabitans houttuyneae TaxID=1076126 RepID=A0A6V8KHG2_9ACTN|nr:hypothetical protein [Phytohabitans houttuyneae]GFJ81436.1 hypothetical protein Phou_056160 [Phytohabitans houttuyneae]